MNPGSVGPTYLNLGGKLIKIQLSNRVVAWSDSNNQYIQKGIKFFETHLTNQYMEFIKGASNPLSS